MSALVTQVRTEMTLALRNGEQVLVSLIIPLVVLVFFSLVEVLPLPAGVDDPVQFLAPGVLALAVMSTAMVSLGISTGFERQYGVLKRLGATPLGRGRWVGAKVATVLGIEVIQVAVLVPTALLLGWEPGIGALAVPVAMVAGTAAFAGIGLTMAGTLKGTITLALANGVYLVLLLLGGMVFPLEALPTPLEAIARALPAGALSDVLATASAGTPGPSGMSWAVLGVWAVAAPLVAVRTFRWE